jgi:hypothetical protein
MTGKTKQKIKWFTGEGVDGWTVMTMSKEGCTVGRGGAMRLVSSSF